MLFLKIGIGNLDLDIIHLIFLFFLGFSIASLMFIRKKENKPFPKLLIRSILIPSLLFLSYIIITTTYDYFTKPMNLQYSDFKGDYVINTNMFKGKNADWQYDHYWLHITSDSLYLNIMDQGKPIKTFKRQIGLSTLYKYDNIFFPKDYTLRTDSIRYVRDTAQKLQNKLYARNPLDTYYIHQVVSDSLYYSRLTDKGIPSHHMLKTDPQVHREAFSFNLILRSSRYGNMFFKKGKWEKR